MIILDYKDKRPLYEQITDRISELILRGILMPGEKLPSVRNLAMELSINPNTIQRAYGELEHKGFIYSVKGRGNFVSDDGNLLQQKQEEILGRMRSVVQEAKDHGVEQKEVKLLIEEIYKGGEADD